MTDPFVDLSIQIDASPDTVWDIVTTPELFSIWMNGTVTFEPEIGSPFHAQFPSFQTVISGEVTEFDATSHRVSFTWGVESGPHADTMPPSSSLVELVVAAEAAGARVQLRHTKLPSQQEAEEHEAGWRFHLGRLALVANRHDLEAALPAALEGWFSAWNETDDAARLEILRACCSDDIEFRDDWASAVGIEALSMHIGMTLRFAGGGRLEPTGDVRICRGDALFGWCSVSPGGESVDGMNHAFASHEGRLTRVTGFPTPTRA